MAGGAGQQTGVPGPTVAVASKMVGDPDAATLLLAGGGGGGSSGASGATGAGSTQHPRQMLKASGSSVTLKTTHVVGAGGAGGKISRKVGAFGKPKKSKVLCDVSGTGGGVGVGGGVVGAVGAGGKKLQELMLRSTKEQVPRKKIKVSAQQASELCFKGGIGSGSLPNFLTVVPGTLADLPALGAGKKVKSESKLLDVNDMQCDDSFDAAPCCSYTGGGTASPGATIVTTTHAGISKLISTYTQAAASELHTTVGGTTVTTEALICSGGGVGGGVVGGGSVGVGDVVTASSSMGPSMESVVVGGGGGGAGSIASGSGGSSSGEGKVGTKFGKGTLKPKQTKLAKSTKSGTDAGGKKLLKKKRSLKTDSSLKRKKTRVKPALT